MFIRNNMKWSTWFKLLVGIFLNRRTFVYEQCGDMFKSYLFITSETDLSKYKITSSSSVWYVDEDGVIKELPRENKVLH